MGLTQPKAMKVGNEIIWTGKKDLKMYIEEFEVDFMQKTKEFYEQKSILWLAECNCVEYLEAVDAALRKEEENAAFWL